MLFIPHLLFLRVAVFGCEINTLSLSMISRYLLILYLVLAVSANTETFLFLVPNYYDIPLHPQPYTHQRLTTVNTSTLVMVDYPILDVYNYDLAKTSVSIPYQFTEKPQNQLLVKLNNYGDATFDANDVINVKLCWPATIPVNFDLSHRFIRAHDLGLAPERLGGDTLDIYVVLEYQADFYSVRDDLASSMEFNLVIAKLPNSLPVPIELYDFIVYLVDMCILFAAMYEYVMEGIKRAFFA